MNISGIMSDLDEAAIKLSNISSDVANMVVIDGSLNSTRDMNDKLKNIRTEIMDVANVIEKNKEIIQSCCDALGISVYFSSSGGGSNANSSVRGAANRNVSYNALK